MHKQYILFIPLLLATTVNANLPRTQPLFAQIKNNQFCIFIQDDKASLGYQDRAYVYTTNFDELSSRSDDYEKIYYNIEIPKNFKNCISIPLDYMERNKPHDIFIELDKTYSLRICISENNQIYRVDPSQKCSNELYEVKQQKPQSLLDRIFAKIKEILAKLFG